MLKFFLLIIFQLFLLLSPQVTQAHETQIDNEIGAILHVDPGDSPIAGEPSTLFFEFTDMQGKLDLNNCICEIVIKRGDQEILKQDFSGADDKTITSGVIDFTFPESDIYRVLVSGKPKDEGQFQAFNLTFLIRVEGQGPKTITEAHNQPHNTWQDHFVHYLPTVLVILGLFLLMGFVKGKKKLTLVLLAGLIVFHSVPVKAIHASHNGDFVHESFACCLPVSAVLPDVPNVISLNSEIAEYLVIADHDSKEGLSLQFYIRPPPSF